MFDGIWIVLITYTENSRLYKLCLFLSWQPLVGCKWHPRIISGPILSWQRLVACKWHPRTISGHLLFWQLLISSNCEQITTFSLYWRRPVQRRKWSRDRKWFPTGNDPQIGPQMIPDRKWSPDWTANDPGKKTWNGVGVLMIVNWKILAVK